MYDILIHVTPLLLSGLLVVGLLLLWQGNKHSYHRDTTPPWPVPVPTPTNDAPDFLGVGWRR